MSYPKHSLRSRGRPFQAAPHAFADQLNQILQLAFIRYLDALKSWFVAIRIDAIQEQDVKVDIQVERGSEALDQCDRAGGVISESISSLVDQMGRDRALNDTQHLAHRLGVGSKQVP